MFGFGSEFQKGKRGMVMVWSTGRLVKAVKWKECKCNCAKAKSHAFCKNFVGGGLG